MRGNESVDPQMVSQQPAHSAHPDRPAASNSKMATPRSSSSPSGISFARSLGNYFRRLFALLAEWICGWIREWICGWICGWIVGCFCPEDGGYREVALSPTSAARLAVLGHRKTLVLDLDETLVHSCNEDPARPGKWSCCGQMPEKATPDYVINVEINNGIRPIAIRVFKRPHVDFFLSVVSKWYDLVIYTASKEQYAGQVVDRLDGGRGLLTRRFYRQHCRLNKWRSRNKDLYLLTKDLTRISKDMRRTFIVDNSPAAYRDFPDNALPIKSFVYDPEDTELLNLLPFLDALRFTSDVRSVLGRRRS